MNGNKTWSDDNVKEYKKQQEFDVFIDKGVYDNTKIPVGYRKIWAHTIFDVKHDGQHQARVVADSHLTEVPSESIYSDFFSLHGLCICIFLCELNGMKTWRIYISSAYLCAKTSEKVYIKANQQSLQT